MAELRDLFKYYLEHQVELVAKYEGKYLVIKDNEVVGVFETQDEAYMDSIGKYELGTFLIQKCTEGDEDYTQHYYSRVVFA